MVFLTFNVFSLFGIINSLNYLYTFSQFFFLILSLMHHIIIIGYLPTYVVKISREREREKEGKKEREREKREREREKGEGQKRESKLFLGPPARICRKRGAPRGARRPSKSGRIVRRFGKVKAVA
uniref:Uncharacterized protein n=1 Tax=Cacopsylla melanoneura TaxID=428564 RepID=A0A8D8ULN0_9HEMI